MLGFLLCHHRKALATPTRPSLNICCHSMICSGSKPHPLNPVQLYRGWSQKRSFDRSLRPGAFCLVDWHAHGLSAVYAAVSKISFTTAYGLESHGEC
jgi:hypothetical protein